MALLDFYFSFHLGQGKLLILDIFLLKEHTKKPILDKLALCFCGLDAVAHGIGGGGGLSNISTRMIFVAKNPSEGLRIKFATSSFRGVDKCRYSFSNLI